MHRSSIISFLLLIISISCDNEEPLIITVQNGPPGIYVGGQDTGGMATLWKDGVPTQLAGGGGSKAEYIFVNGSDIYLAGKTSLLNGNFSSLVYWKNGSPNTIRDLNSENANALLKGFTLSGNDLHAVWNENTGNYSVIKYWKNGIITSITDVTHYAIATSLVVYGNDVYIGGYESEGGYYVAKYWKNGKSFLLTDGKTSAYAKSIFIDKGNVYVAGMTSTSPDISKDVLIAKYWKNGVAVDLSDGSKNASANSIFVNDEGVFVAGSESVSTQSEIQIAKYWKNNVVSSLTSGFLHGSANQITVSDKDIYVVGRDAQVGTIWKNGIKLPPFDTDDPSVSPLCISVIK